MTDHKKLIAEARRNEHWELFPATGRLLGKLADALEAVLPPALVPYRGMILEDVKTKELWVYDPVDEGMEWIGLDSEALSEEFIAKRFAAGELTIFTPEGVS